MAAPRFTLLHLAALAGMACCLALLSNGLASPARRLRWTGSPLERLPAPPQPERYQPPAPPTGLSPAELPAKPRSLATVPPPKVRLERAAESPRTPPVMSSEPIRDIDNQGAWAAHQAGAAFLDARRSAEFAAGHIPGAWSTPVWEADLEDRLILFKAQRRPGSEDAIVLYCSGGDCQDSHLLAARLLRDGYGHLLVYREGLPGWVAQGHPVEKGQP